MKSQDREESTCPTYPLKVSSQNHEVYRMPPGLVKNHQTPKTFNKGKKAVWGKECPSNYRISGSQFSQHLIQNGRKSSISQVTVGSATKFSKPSSVRKFLIQQASVPALNYPMYSASVVDMAMVD